MKAFETIYDYEPCKQHAIQLLSAYPEAVSAFFKKLDPILPKQLTSEEKQWIIITFVNCMLHHPEPSPAVEAFINLAIQFKKEVSIRHFISLFSPIAKASEAKLLHYIGLCQRFCEQKEMFASEDDFMFSNTLYEGYYRQKLFNEGNLSLMLEVLNERHKTALNEQYEEFENISYGVSPSLERAMVSFATLTEFVQFKLSGPELRELKIRYKQLMQFEKPLLYCSKIEFQSLAMAHIPLLKAEPNNLDHQLKMLALLRHAIRFMNGKYPYVTQMLTVLALLLHPKGRIGQVRTGEGKSTLFTILVAFLSTQYEQVLWITSAKDLAKRDYDDSKEVFELLGISIICVSKQEAANQELNQSILVGTNCDFEFMVLRDCFKLPKDEKLTSKKRVAVIDEIDNLLIDRSKNSARIASNAPNPKPWMYRPLLAFMRSQGKDAVITDELITAFRSQLTLVQGGKFKDDVAIIPVKRLRKLLESAHEALYVLKRKHEYDVINGKIEIVDKENTGAVQPGMRWSNGKHECVEVKEGLDPGDETVTCAAISHPSFFNRYFEARFGLTGTMGGLEERNIVENQYGVTCFDVPHHKPNHRTMLPAFLCLEEDDHREMLAHEIHQKLKLNHPILILTPNIEASENVHAFLKEELKQYFKAGEFQVQLLNDRQTEDKGYIIAQAGNAGVVTVATTIAARGTDIIIRGKDNPGLYLLLTFYPENVRVEEQIFGRVGRQSQPGFCKMILQLNDPFICKLIPIKKDRIALYNNEQFLERLSELRIAHVTDQFKQDALQADRDRALFAITLSFSTLFKASLVRMSELSISSLGVLAQNRRNFRTVFGHNFIATHR